MHGDGDDIAFGSRPDHRRPIAQSRGDLRRIFADCGAVPFQAQTHPRPALLVPDVAGRDVGQIGQPVGQKTDALGLALQALFVIHFQPFSQSDGCADDFLAVNLIAPAHAAIVLRLIVDKAVAPGRQHRIVFTAEDAGRVARAHIFATEADQVRAAARHPVHSFQRIDLPRGVHQHLHARGVGNLHHLSQFQRIGRTFAFGIEEDARGLGSDGGA